MGLGQTLLVLGAVTILGLIILNAGVTVLTTNETQSTSEFGLTAIALATSLVEEANGKMFDEKIADSLAATVTDPSDLTPASKLGKETGEHASGSGKGFNDFDDFNGLTVVYKNPVDSARYTGYDREIVVKDIRATFVLRAKVEYVSENNLDMAVSYPTWHKKLTVTVVSPNNPSMRDSLVYPTIMSYWN
jgi:hypothetical protein